MTQCEMIKEILLSEGWVDDQIAMREACCKRLSARIEELRNDEGLDIETVMESGVNRFGKKYKYCSGYRLHRKEGQQELFI